MDQIDTRRYLDPDPAPEPVDAASARYWLGRHGLDGCELDDRTPVERALALIPVQERSKAPESLAVMGALRAFAGNAEDALRIYNRALALNPPVFLANGVRTNLAALHYRRGESLEADRTIAAGLEADPEDPRLRALRAFIRGKLKDRNLEVDIEFVESVVGDLPHVWQARIHIWLGAAATYLHDTGRSDRHWHRAAEIAEEIQCSRIAALAYYNLADFLSNAIGDVAQAMMYARFAIDAAQRSRDQGLHTTAIVVLYALAAEAGDQLEANAARGLLASKRTSGRVTDNFLVVFSDALWFAWAKRFDEMANVLKKLDAGNIEAPQRAILYGLLAIALVGSENDEAAEAAARMAIGQGRLNTKESPVELRLRRIGRILGCAALYHTDNKSEATRALEAFKDYNIPLSVRRLASAVRENSYKDLRDTAPDVMGYVLALEALENVRASIVSRSISLTARERQILQMLSIGASIADIAKELNVDESTVKGHNFRIYRKLGVKRSLGAVAEARRLRLIK